MGKFCKKIAIDVSTPFREQRLPLIYKFLYPITWGILILALIMGASLLASDTFATRLPHVPISSAPLLLIGVAYLAFQVLIRASLLDLFKALIVSSAFIFWGIDQLLPQGWFATTLGDVVIVLYVIDLGWIMMGRLKQQWKSHHMQSVRPSSNSNVSSPELDKSMPLLLHHIVSGEQQNILPHFVALPKGNTSFLKRNRLAPLSCTCTSPLAPFQSSTCCRAMSEPPHSL